MRASLESQTQPSDAAQLRAATRTSLRIGLMLGVGLAGTLDAVILHQWLQWHHLYVHTTPFRQQVIEGVFHLITSGLLFWGAIFMWEQRKLVSAAGRGRALAAGIFLGLGGFNLYDGTIQHKLLNLHQVREGVANLLPYDIVFVGIAVAVLLVGLVLWRGVNVQR